MKFVPEENSPDIPLSLLEAQEAGQLVFFCGSGISVPAGIPTFDNLVESIYKELSIDKSDSEKIAIEAKLYDRALHLLEQRLPEKLVRQTIINELR